MVGTQAAVGSELRPGQVDWACRNLGHFQDQSPIMEVKALVWFPEMEQASPTKLGCIAYFVQEGTYNVLVDSGCNQTLIHQSLIQGVALEKAC